MTHKQLYRSRNNRMIGGVAAGIADYFSIDPVIVRLAFVLLALVQGIGILFYLIAWVIVPEESNHTPDEHPKAKKSDHDTSPEAPYKSVAADMKKEWDNHWSRRDRQRPIIGMIIIGLGILFLIQNIFSFNITQLWPLLLIVIGISIIIRSTTYSKE